MEKGKYVLGGGFGHPAGPRLFSRDIGPAVPGTVTDLVVHVVFSADPAKGLVQVWQDGRRTLDGVRPPGGTLYSGNGGYRFGYWKIGIYRDSGITTPGVTDLTAARVGTSFAAVASP